MKKGVLMILGLLLILLGNSNIYAGEKTGVKNFYYLVFEQENGIVKLISHRLVPMMKNYGDLKNRLKSRFSSDEKDLFGIRLFSQSGEIVYEDAVGVPQWIRGEFHSETGEGIDGYEIDTERKYFVVRVPAISGAAKLELQSIKYSISNAFDLLVLPETRNLALSLTAPASAASVALPGIITGSPANRVDLLIMGDGYTEAERPKFETDVNKLLEEFFNISPYREYRNFVNIHVLFTASQESGTDHPPYNQNGGSGYCTDEAAKYDTKAPKFVNTALGSSFCWGGTIHRLLAADYQLVLSAAAAVPDWDRIMVLVNDDTYGGSGGGISTVSTNPLVVQVAQHEYGHSFTGLADEYEYGGGTWVCQEANNNCPPNVTNITLRENIKWSPWIMAATPIPTPEDDPYYYDIVGLFEGAMYIPYGIYRPASHCMMRDLSEFCPICKQEYALKLYTGWLDGVPENGINLIEPGSEVPTPGSVLNESGQPVSFKANLLKPDGSDIEIIWLVNDQPIPGANSNTFTYYPAPGESAKIELRVRDTTPLVHLTKSEPLLSSRVWQLSELPQMNISILEQFNGQKLPLSSMTADVAKNLIIIATTDDGLPISGATINLNGAGIFLAGVTNKTGKVFFRKTILAVNGEVVITVVKDGYQPTEIRIPVEMAQFNVSVTIAGQKGKSKAVRVLVKNTVSNKKVIGAEVIFSGLVSQTFTTAPNAPIVLKGVAGPGELTIQIAKQGYLNWQTAYQIE